MLIQTSKCPSHFPGALVRAPLVRAWEVRVRQSADPGVPPSTIGTIGAMDDRLYGSSDPTEDPWDNVGLEFKKLGGRLRDAYGRAADGAGPTEEEVRDAFAVLARAWSQVAGSVGEALKDPEVRDILRSAASSLATALGSTISDLGTELARDEEE